MSNINVLEELLKRKRAEEQQNQQMLNQRKNRVILPVNNTDSSIQTKTMTNNKISNSMPHVQNDVNKIISSMNKVNLNQKQSESKNFSNQITNPTNTKLAYLSEDEQKEAKKTTAKINMQNNALVKNVKSLDDNLNVSGSVENLGLGILDATSKGVSYIDKIKRYVQTEIPAKSLEFLANQFSKSEKDVITNLKINGENLTVAEVNNLALAELHKNKDINKYYQLKNYAKNYYDNHKSTDISNFLKISAELKKQYEYKNDANHTDGIIDLISDKWADNEDISKKRQEKMQANIDKAQNVVGSKLAELTGGMGSTVLGMAGTAVNPILGTILFSTSAGGGYYEDAKQRGMTEGQSLGYATVMAVMEGATEKYITGDMVSKVKKIATGSELSAKTLRSFGMNIVENFAQEALTEPISEITAYVVGGKNTTNFDKMYERMLESGWNGLLSATILAGASAGIGSAIAVTQKGKDATLQENIQAYNDTVASGKVDQSSIAKGVVEGLTEQVKTIKGQETKDKRTNNVLPNLKDKIIENKAENDLRQQITQEENKMSQNRTSLQNSNTILPLNHFEYIPSDNKNVDDFRQDASKNFYNTKETQNFVNIMEKIILDKNVVIRLNTNLKTADGKVASGSYSNGIITINPNSNRAGEFIAIHELTHAIGTKQMINMVEKYRKSNTEFDSAVKSLLQNYNETEITEEALSDVSAQLFGNQEFISGLSQSNPNLFQRIYNEIKYLWHQFRGYKNQNQFVEDLYYKWTKAYNSNKQLNGKTNYHISDTFSVEIDQSLKGEIPSNNQVKARDYTPEILVKNGVKDLPMLLTQKHLRQIIYTQQEAERLGYKINKKDHYHGLGKEKLLKAIDNLDNPSAIYKQSENNYLIITELKDNNGNPIIVPIQINGTGTYNDVRILENQISTVYGHKRLNNYLLDNNFQEIYKKNRSLVNSERVKSHNSINNTSINSIPSQNKDVNTTTKYSIQESENNSGSFSMQDNQGRTLTKEQQEYFKDSKVRDKDGNLKTMYHGSNNKFTIFKHGEAYRGSSKASVGYWFTEMAKGAENFANSVWYGDTKTGAKVYEVYLNIKNPKIYNGIDNTNELHKIDNNINNVKETIRKLENKNIAIEINKQELRWANSKEELRDIAKYEGIDFEDAENYHNAIKQYNELIEEYDNKKYNDAYELFRADIYKIAGKNANEANIGGTGMYLSNEEEVVKQYVESLKKQGYDGIIIKNTKFDNETLGKNNSQYVVFEPSQIKNVSNTNPTSNPDIRYSKNSKTWQSYLDKNFKSTGTRTNLEDIKLPTKEYFENKNKESATNTEEVISLENKPMKDKVRKYIARSKKRFINNIVDKFQTSYYSNKDILNDTMDKLINEIEGKDTIDKTTASEIFEELYSKMVKIDETYHNEFKDVKNNIRKTKLYVPEDVRSSITDYNDFRQNNMGNLILTSDSNNISIDAKYKELSSQYPALFPDSIINPADQLERMAEIQKDITKTETNVGAYLDSTMGAEYKKWAKHDFEKALDDFIEDVNLGFRYNNDTKANNNSVELNELKDMFDQLPYYQREYEKVANKEVLTAKDRVQLDRLLKEEITLDELPKNTNIKGIKKVYEAKLPYQTLLDAIQENKAKLNNDRIEEAKILISNADSWKDKKIGFQYNRETARRNIYDIMPKEDADKIYKKYFEPYSINEAQATRDINRYNDMIKDLNIRTAKKYKISTGTKVSESTLVQMFGENRISLEELKRSGANVEKIENATKVFREIYDELFDKLNESSIKNGYNPIQKRKDYFPHFTEVKPDTLLSKLASKVGIDLTNQELPTDIAGITAQFKPGRKWMGNLLHRYSDITDFDALKGFDNYVRNATDIIYHTEDIKNLRTLISAIRYNYSDKGIKEKIDNIKEDSSLDELEKVTQIQELFENKDTTHLSKFVTWLNEYTNSIAGKKSMADRNWEYNLGRNIYNTMSNIEKRISANMIAGNVSVALTNFAPLAQAKGELKTINLANGLWNTLKNTIKKDNSFTNSSNFITNRRGTDYLSKSNIDKIVQKITSPLNLVDDMMSETIVRAKYYENLQNGMQQEEALQNADEYTAGLMADRSKGQLPITFNNKNPIAKLNTMFQVEVNNQWSYYFKDLPRNTSDVKYAKVKLATAYTKIAIGSYLFNELINSIRGGDNRVLPDIIHIIVELIKGLTDDDDDEATWETLSEAGLDVASNLPFISFPAALLGVEDLGRIPVSGAVPNITNVGKSVSGLITGDMNKDKARDTLKKELSKPLYYILPTAGGAQIKKSAESIKTMQEGGSYSVDSEGNRVLQFPATDLSLGQKIQAGVFGKYALPMAKEYSERGYKTLNNKQTRLYEETKLPYKQLLDYIDVGLTKTEDKINYVKSQDVTENQKWGIYKYNILSSAERDDGSSQVSDAEYMIKNGVSKSEYMNLYNKAVSKNIDMPTSDEYKEMKKSGLSLNKYIDYNIKVKDTTKKKKKAGELKESQSLKDADRIQILLDSNYSDKEIKAIYENYICNKNDSNYNIMKSTNIDIKEYIKYRQQKFESDKKDDGTVDGKSISGSKKKKIYSYVNAMKINYNQKLLLLGQQYKLTAIERTKLANYVNSLKLTKQEKLDIYEKLEGFTVYKNGTVKW